MKNTPGIQDKPKLKRVQDSKSEQEGGIGRGEWGRGRVPKSEWQLQLIKVFARRKTQKEIASNIFRLYLASLQLGNRPCHLQQLPATEQGLGLLPLLEREMEREKSMEHLHAPRVDETFVINKLFMKNK